MAECSKAMCCNSQAHFSEVGVGVTDSLFNDASTPFQPQSQSPLFRLPCEIRLKIWEYCVGHRFIYQPSWARRCSIHRFPGWTVCPMRIVYPSAWSRDTHTRKHNAVVNTKYLNFWEFGHCDQQRESWLDSLCKAYRQLTSGCLLKPPVCRSSVPVHEVQAEITIRQGESWWSGLDLLISCRAICAEVVPLLYGMNTFSFIDLKDFFAFRNLVPSVGLRSVRYLHIRVVPSPLFELAQFITRDCWQAFCESVARDLPLLRELDLNMHYMSNWDSDRWNEVLESTDDLASNVRSLAVNYFESLPDWVDDLRPLEGKLRRARVAVHKLEGCHETSPLHVWDLEEKCLEWECRLTGREHDLDLTEDCLVDLASDL